MSLGFTNSYFYVNSASGLPPAKLCDDDEGVDYTDGQGRVPLEQVVSEAREQGVNVAPETVAGTLVPGKVAIRQWFEQRGGYDKRQANRIMVKYRVVDSAPLAIAHQPAYTGEQLATLLAEHDAQARRNKRRAQRKP